MDMNKIPRNGDPERIRTSDPQLRRLLLYPAELRDQSIVSLYSVFDGKSSTKLSNVLYDFAELLLESSRYSSSR